MDTSRTRLRGQAAAHPAFEPYRDRSRSTRLTPSDRGFTLTGQGTSPDQVEYRVDMHF